MLLCQAGDLIPRDANASEPIAATIRSTSGASADKQTHHLPDTANLMSNMVFEQLTYFSDSQKVTVLSHTDTHRTGTLRLELFPNVSYRLFY